jgi:DNA repair protein RadD
MLKLRDYQLKFKAALLQAWTQYRSVLGVLPTGGGKTMVFSSIVHEHKGAAIVVVHRREILAQISISLAKVGTLHRVVAPPKTVAMIRRKHLLLFKKSFVEPSAPVGVASVQTLTSQATSKDPRLKAWLQQVTLAVFDEGHHYVEAGFWARAVHLFERAKLLFVTATPERADGTGLGLGDGGFAEVMVEGPTPKELIERGHLSKYVYYAPDAGFDVGDVPLTASGEFNAAAMRARVIEAKLVGKLADLYLKWAPGTKAIAFVESIDTANEVAADFVTKGVNAVALSSKTDEGERERALTAFEHGDVMVLINVDLFDEGFDVPAAVTCLIGRATMSLAKYMQMVGRVLRTAEGKEKAIIIDAVGNWDRHGQVTWPRRWTLKGREKGENAASDKPKQKVCTGTVEAPGCTQPYEAFRLACPHCGMVPEPADRSSLECVEGDLSALDLDALDALFAAKEKANVEEDEFRRGLYARNVPAIGHNAQVTRFRATKYRREVLRHLMAWWGGCQPGDRMPAEKQKRFFLRFGVDVLTAETLGLRETDDLIEKIAKKFDKDIVTG